MATEKFETSLKKLEEVVRQSPFFYIVIYTIMLTRQS